MKEKKKEKLLDKKIRGPQTELTTWSGIRPNLLCRLLKQWHGDTISCYFRSLYPNNRRNPSKLNIKLKKNPAHSDLLPLSHTHKHENQKQKQLID